MTATPDIHELNLPDTVPDPRGLVHCVTKIYSMCSAMVGMLRGPHPPACVEFRYVVDTDSQDIIVRVRDMKDNVVTQFQVVYYSATGWVLRNYARELGPVGRMCHYLNVPVIKDEELQQFNSLVQDILKFEEVFWKTGYKDYKF